MDVKASYAVTDEIAVAASYGDTYNIETEYTVNGGETVKSTLKNDKADLGLGYYTLINDMYFNAFGGYSFGNSGSLFGDIYTVAGSITDDDFGITAKFNGPFIQSALHKDLGGETYLGLVTRFDYLSFSDFKTAVFLTDQQVDEVTGDKDALIGQIGLDLNIRGEAVGWTAQVSYTFADNTADYFSNRTWNINLGVYLRLEEVFGK